MQMWQEMTPEELIALSPRINSINIIIDMEPIICRIVRADANGRETAGEMIQRLLDGKR